MPVSTVPCTRRTDRYVDWDLLTVVLVACFEFHSKVSPEIEDGLYSESTVWLGDWWRFVGFGGAQAHPASARRARRLSVSQIRRYEAGDSTPNLDVLRKLSIALSVSADTLVFDANERGPTTTYASNSRPPPASPTTRSYIVKTVIESILLRRGPSRCWC